MIDFANYNDFLQIPDVSTTLEGYHASRITPTVAIEFLSSEYKKFRENQYASLFSQEGHRIPSTNILLTLSDKNPDSTLDTHPGHKKIGVRTEWGNTPISEWVNLYEKAFNLLRKISPDFDYELSRIIKKIIPLGESQSSHNSASYSLCIGHLYMSYPTHIEFPELAILDAIIHESNHNKMNLIIKQDPLILNDKREIYYSPYRPDPRHIHGVYL